MRRRQPLLTSRGHSLGISRILTALVAAAILVASLLPFESPPGGPFTDKILHLAAYVLLGLLLFLATGKKGPAVVLASIGFCTAYGGLIEIVQPLFGRSRELADWIVDFAGASVGTFLGVPARGLLARVAAG